MGEPEPQPPPQPPAVVVVRQQAPFVPGGGPVAAFLWSRSAHQSTSVQERTDEVYRLAASQLDKILNTVPPEERELVTAAMARVSLIAQRRNIGMARGGSMVLERLGTHCEAEVVRAERAWLARS